MAGWSTTLNSHEINESSPGSGAWGEEFQIPPGGGADCCYHRTDEAGDSDHWLLRVAMTPDGTTPGWPTPQGFRTYRLPGTHLKKPFKLPAGYAYKIYVKNDDGSPTDTVEGTFYWRTDGIAV